MRHNGGYAAICLLLTLFGIGIMLIILKYSPPIYVDIAVSLFFSVLIPAAFLVARNHVRNNRIHAAEVFCRTFDGSLSSNIFFEFIERKYCSGNAAPSVAGGSNVKYSGADIPGWLLLGACLPFMMFTAAGVFILLLPATESAQLLSNALGTSVSSAGEHGVSDLKDYENTIAIASLAFASSFLYSVRLFLRSLAAYGPFAIVLLRAFAHMLFAVMLAVMIWHVAPSTEPLTKVATKVQNSIVSDNNGTIRPSHDDARDLQEGTAQNGKTPKLWLALALAIGFVPDYAFSWLLQRARLTFNRRTRAGKHAAVTPLTVIDGIDFAKAFRLEEGNIAGVENLAVANPVMLHVETPYCIFQIMDWIAQAQLCSAVGPERFLLFRKINIRTIFDLERAVLDATAPAGLKQIVGAVLLANDGANTSLLRDFGVRPLDMAHRDFDKALTSWVNVEVIEHLVRVIIDNLHTHHFWQLWLDIEAALPPAKSEKVQRGGPNTLPGQVAAAAPSHSNGGGGNLPSGELAAGGTAPHRTAR